MKFLRTLIDNQKALLDKSEKTKKFWPLVDALDTFAFTPNHTTHSGSHVRDGIDLKRTMMTVIIALVPCLLFGMWNIGHQHFLAIGEQADLMQKFFYGAIKVLPVIVVAYAVGLGVEFIFCIKNGHAIQEGFLVSGLLIPLIMPIGTPLWMIAIATAFAVLIAKEVFGGTGMNVLNIALTARAFLFFAHPTMMSGDKVWVDLAGKTPVDGFSGATYLGKLASFTADSPAYASLQQFYTELPFMDAMIGAYPGSIGESSVIACLIGAFVLLYTGIGSWRVMLSFLAGGLGMALLFNQIAGDNMYMQVDPIYQIMLGGFMFGMVFMITDPVTAAQTNTGKWIYGLIGGSLAILIRVANPAYPEGVMLAILFANVMAPIIDHYVIQSNIKRRLKRVKTA